MQTPEEFAALLDRCAHTAEGMGERLTDTYRVADLIRARDAEVAEQVRAEFEDMEHRLSVLLCNLTGGLLSKTGYDVATMEQHIEDYLEREVVEPARAEVRADERAKVLAGFTEWFAPGFTYPNGRTVPIGGETVAREFAAADARDMASPEDDTPTLVVRRLVGPWEPIEGDDYGDEGSTCD